MEGEPGGGRFWSCGLHALLCLVSLAFFSFLFLFLLAPLSHPAPAFVLLCLSLHRSTLRIHLCYLCTAFHLLLCKGWGGWTTGEAGPASHPAADVGLRIGEELVSEWQMLPLSPPTALRWPQWKGGPLWEGCPVRPWALEGVPEAAAYLSRILGNLFFCVCFQTRSLSR